MTTPNRNLRTALSGYTAIAFVLAVVSVFLAGLIFGFLPALADTGRIMLGIALLFFVVFAIGAFDTVSSGLRSRQARYGTNALVMVLAFAAIMVVVNFLAAQFPQRIDMTAGGQFTLTQHTLQILKDLKEPVKVMAFLPRNDADSQAQSGAAQEQMESLLKEYENNTTQVSHQFIDPALNPSVARQYQVTADTGVAVVVEQAGRRQRLQGLSEQDFTGGILKVLGKEQLKLFFLTGHGERSITAAPNDPAGYGAVAQALDAENYQVGELNLTSGEAKIPADAALIVIASPRQPLLDPEIRAIDDYLANGGKGLFLLDPDTRPEVVAMLEKWGVKAPKGMLLDPASSLRDQPQIVVATQRQQVFGTITQYLTGSIFPEAVGLALGVPSTDDDHVVVAPLVTTTPDAFLKTDGSDRKTFDQSKGDIRSLFGFVLAATVQADRPIGQRPSKPQPPKPAQGQPQAEPPERPTRIVVFGDSDFATNNYISSLTNGDFIVNAVNWLTANEALIAIRPKPPEFRRLVITNQQWTFIQVSAIAIWPALMLVAGGWVWWRRR